MIMSESWINETKNNTCKFCGKTYSRKDSYNKHKVLCEFSSFTKNEKKITLEELDDIPSYEQLIKIVQQLTIEHMDMKEQIKRLQNKLTSIQNNDVCNKNKTNAILNPISPKEHIEWIKNNIKPDLIFEEWLETSFNYINKDNFKEINGEKHLLDYICKNIISMHKNNITVPLYGFLSKPNNLYIYKSFLWLKITDEELTQIMKEYITHILKIQYIWYNENEETIKNNKNLQDLHKTINGKVFLFDYNCKINISKFKKNIIDILQT